MNKFERKDITLKELASGDHLGLTLYRISGESPGPHVHIQASVHGAEVQGNLVIMELIRQFAKIPLHGSVTLIPLANPLATNTKVGTHTQGRYNSVSGHNWNRNYTDLSSYLDAKTFAQQHQGSDWKKIKSAYKLAIVEACNQASTHLSKNGLSENHKLNLLLQKLAAPADIVLDLHTGPIACR
jgi:uncharacterized protein